MAEKIDTKEQQEALIKENEEGIKACEIDKGGNFLSGGSTSAMTTVSMAAGGALVANQMAKDPAMAKQVGEALVVGATTILMDTVGMMVAQGLMDITTASLNLPSKINSYAMIKFNEEKLTLSYFVNNATQNQDQKNEESETKAEEEENKKQSKKIKDSEAKLSKQKEKAEKLSYTSGKIASSVQEGPEGTKASLSQFIENGTYICQSGVDYVVNGAIGGINKFAKSMGDKQGKRMANKYNDNLKKAAEKQKQQTDKSKTKAKTKAFAAMQKGVLKVMALTGVNIPV